MVYFSYTHFHPKLQAEHLTAVLEPSAQDRRKAGPRKEERDGWNLGLGRCWDYAWVVAAKGGPDGTRT